MAVGEEWASKLCEAVNVQAVKDYRHYRCLQRELYAEHMDAVERRDDAIRRAKKEVLKRIDEYDKKVARAEKEFEKENKKYSRACEEVKDLRDYFNGEPWGDINGKWVMDQVDEQIELYYERMNKHE